MSTPREDLARPTPARPDAAAVAPAPAGPVLRLPMAIGDRMGRGGMIACAFGPLDLPDRTAIVDALVRISTASPESRAGLAFAATGSGWIHDPAGLAAHCAGAVSVVDPLDPDDLAGDLCRRALDIDADRPLHYQLAGDYLLQFFDHSVGDSVLLLSLPAAILGVAAGGPLPEWLGERTARHPLADAVRHTFLRHPGQFLAAVNARQDPRAELDARAEAVGLPDPVRPRPRETRPWRPEPAFSAVTITKDSAKLIRSWSRKHAGGASFTAVLTMMLRRALERSGVPVAPASTLVYDLRRYLPPGSTVFGNFITGIPLRVANPDDPEQLDARIQETVASARPLAALLAGAAKHRLRPAPVPVPDRVPVDPVATLVLSNAGVSRSLQQLPWTRTEGTPHHAIFGVRTVGAEQLSVLLTILDGDVHITATFHGNVFDPAAVAGALRLMAAEPETLLLDPADA
ncbi:hypothetical protein [Cryobacterium zhongshanensis]|uniref:Uncharacterized protein n=1 Tax=Cryobacterium zhongshanensis TaxID=2928153 RepID=A0AA41QVE0_9MICO|nr:hypothetical protein [Cryobacterium zhongshanensis]MCI4658139.1 hypothetical protein [Cryobacterium zhongshanensis]